MISSNKFSCGLVIWPGFGIVLSYRAGGGTQRGNPERQNISVGKFPADRSPSKMVLSSYYSPVKSAQLAEKLKWLILGEILMLRRITCSEWKAMFSLVTGKAPMCTIRSPHRTSMNDIKVMKMVAIIILCFFMCWSPFFILTLKRGWCQCTIDQHLITFAKVRKIYSLFYSWKAGLHFGLSASLFRAITAVKYQTRRFGGRWYGFLSPFFKKSILVNSPHTRGRGCSIKTGKKIKWMWKNQPEICLDFINLTNLFLFLATCDFFNQFQRAKIFYASR